MYLIFILNFHVIDVQLSLCNNKRICHLNGFTHLWYGNRLQQMLDKCSR